MIDPASAAAPGDVLLSGQDPTGARVVSVVAAMRYLVARNGACSDAGPPIVATELTYYDDDAAQGRLQPRVLRRDIDAYAWRGFTDIVVQGTARSERARSALLVTLECASVQLALAVRVSGDRWIERGPGGLRFSEPQPFTAMPMRFDRAYGGFDRLAEARHGNPKLREFMTTQFGPESAQRSSRFAYPRNPAGKGYVIDADSAVGTPLPNLEFPNDALTPERLLAPVDAWARRPYPAAFDWFSHAWFPRIGMLGIVPPTQDDEPPQPETGLGLLAPDIRKIPRLKRVRHELAQGSHPFLWRHRLKGDEQIQVTAMSTDGRDFQVTLPAHRPHIFIKQPSEPEEAAPAVLDAVFIETDLDRVTLVWRGSLRAHKPEMPRGFECLCTHRVTW